MSIHSFNFFFLRLQFYDFSVSSLLLRGTAVAQWLNRKVAGSIPAGVIGFFIDIKSFRSHYGTGVDSASNINEYQKYFQGGKGGRCLRLTTYHHPVPLSRNLETLTSWNPLGLSRPVMGLLYLYLYPDSQDIYNPAAMSFVKVAVMSLRTVALASSSLSSMDVCGWSV